MRLAEEGLRFLASTVDTLIVIPNQNLFQMVDKQTSLLDSFRSVVCCCCCCCCGGCCFCCCVLDLTIAHRQGPVRGDKVVRVCSLWRIATRVCHGALCSDTRVFSTTGL